MKKDWFDEEDKTEYDPFDEKNKFDLDGDKSEPTSDSYAYYYKEEVVPKPIKKKGGGVKIAGIIMMIALLLTGILAAVFLLLTEFGVFGDVGELLSGIPGLPDLGGGDDEIPHQHTESGWIIDREATCTEYGLHHKECDECGEITVTEALSPLGHNTINHQGKAPSCEEIGWDSYVTCSRCNYSSYSELDATGHSTSDGLCSSCNVLFISSAETLYTITVDSVCQLMCDIDLDGSTWTPIDSFKGSFDGRGHTISNIEITTAANETGFFAHNSGEIKNLGLKNITLHADTGSYAGGLVALNSGNITNCYTEGEVRGTHIVGGLVADNVRGTISFCHSSCSVSGDKTDLSSGHCGVLVGLNRTEGVITNSYATGDLLEAGIAGGFVGRNAGLVQDCYSTGNVWGSYAGGFTSSNLGTIINCYSTGNVSYVSSYTSTYGCSGGFLGSNGQDRGEYLGTLENCFATGNVSVRSSTKDCYLGGLLAYEYEWYGSLSVVKNSYYYSGQSLKMFVSGGFSNKPTLTVGEAAEIDTLKSVSFQKETLGLSEDSWIFTDGSYPTLKSYEQYSKDMGSGEDGEHIHIPGTWTVLRNPTCEGEGLRSLCCLDCGELIASESISSLGHAFGSWQTIPGGGCCEESYSVRICINCKEIGFNKDIGGISHPHDMKLEVTEATCTNDGRVIVSCKNCNIVGADQVLPKLGHSIYYAASSSVHTAVCGRAGCSYREESAPHVSSVSSPCIDNACKVCGYIIWEGIGHQFGNSYESNAEHHWAKCEREGCNLSGDKEAHSSSSAKCTDKSALCEVCGATFDPKNAHIMGEWYLYSEPDCLTGQIMRRECTLCGAVENDEGSPLGHDFGSWTVITEPTETKKGEKRRECLRCGEVETKEISPTGHNFSPWYITSEPTCEGGGEKRRDCTDCNYHETEVLPSYGHYVPGWVVTLYPTCFEGGLEFGYCDRCSERIERAIAPSGHSFDEYKSDSTHHWKICSECNMRSYYGSHAGGKNGCEGGAVCRYCNYEYGEAIGHRYDNNYSHDENNHYYNCLNGCGIKKSSETHSFKVEYETVTSTDTGAEIRYTHNFYKICDICGYKTVEKSVVGSEHYGCTVLNYVAPTCTKSGLTWGWKCSVKGCSDVYVPQEIIPALGHDYVNGKCTRCSSTSSGDSQGGGQTGHVCTASTYTITVAPTCTSEGVAKYYCSCGRFVKQERISKSNHFYVLTPGVEATCTSTGISDYIRCKDCGKVYQSQYETPMIPHKSSGWIVDQKYSIFKDGKEHRECVVCGEVLESRTENSLFTVLMDRLSEIKIPEHISVTVLIITHLLTDPYFSQWVIIYSFWGKYLEELEKLEKKIKKEKKKNLNAAKDSKDDDNDDDFGNGWGNSFDKDPKDSFGKSHGDSLGSFEDDPDDFDDLEDDDYVFSDFDYDLDSKD